MYPIIVHRYNVTYDVVDTYNNTAQTVWRAVTVKDTTPPVLHLVGEPVMRVRCRVAALHCAAPRRGRVLQAKKQQQRQQHLTHQSSSAARQAALDSSQHVYSKTPGRAF